MEDISRNKNSYSFGEYHLSGLTERLSCNNEHVKLEPQLFNLLLLLVTHNGETVNRQQIQDEVWAGRSVSDEAIRVAIKKLRDTFKDDAKAPRYIKTIPRKGYRWLAPVKLEKNGGEKYHAPQVKVKKRFLWSALGLLFLSISLFMLWPQPKNASPRNQNTVKVDSLTSLSGSEVYADYHQADNKLAFLHRDARNSPQQLYTKHLDSGLVKRLSWDKANYSNGAWSKDGKHLAFNRQINNEQSLHIARFDESGDVNQLITLDNPQLADKFVIGWLHDQTGLLLAQEIKAGRQHSIYRYSIENDTLEAISSPNVSGQGDYFASLSPDGSKIALLREVGKQQVSLLVLDMATGDMLANKVLPFRASKLAWQYSDDIIILSSFFGQSSRYILNTDFFDPYPTLPENSLDVFNSCGDRCYILRQHNGNFLDIQETPISALSIDQNQANLSPVLESGRLFKLSGAQDFPRYLIDRQTKHSQTDNQLVYASLIDKVLFFKKLDQHNQTHTLGQLKATYQLSALSVSHNAKTIAGIAEGRLFVLPTDANNADPRFLTSSLERVANPLWHEDNQRLYLTSITENMPSIILYDTQTKERESIIGGLVAFQPRFGTSGSAIGIDINGLAWALTNNKGKWEKQKSLTQISSPNPHHWQAVGNTLYFSTMLGREAQLCQYSLDFESANQEPKCASTGQNRFRLGFDIHPSQKKILLVESLGAQSDIVKMTW